MPMQISIGQAKRNLRRRKQSHFPPSIACDPRREDALHVVLVDTAYAFKNLLNNHDGIVTQIELAVVI
jgi:hypothetical protein